MPPILTDSPEDLELKKRQKTIKRIRILGILLILSVAARFLIKNPPAYTKPEHKTASIRYLPGMLDAMDEETRAKLTPEQIRKFKEADLNARRAPSKPDRDMDHYKPAGPVEEIQEDIEAYKEELFQFAKRQERMEEIRFERRKVVDYTKPVVVQFKGGGYVKVAKTNQNRKNIDLIMNNGLKMNLSKKFVKRVRKNAAEWTPPVPRGYVKLEPARGITVLVKNRTARRITIHKEEFYEM